MASRAREAPCKARAPVASCAEERTCPHPRARPFSAAAQLALRPHGVAAAVARVVHDGAVAAGVAAGAAGSARAARRGAARGPHPLRPRRARLRRRRRRGAGSARGDARGAGAAAGQLQARRSAAQRAASVSRSLAKPLRARCDALAPRVRRDAQLRAHEARHAVALAHELERGADALAQQGAYAAADALYTEALLFAPGAANLLGACTPALRMRARAGARL
jgi:hypothetical protein